MPPRIQALCWGVVALIGIVVAIRQRRSARHLRQLRENLAIEFVDRQSPAPAPMTMRPSTVWTMAVCAVLFSLALVLGYLQRRGAFRIKPRVAMMLLVLIFAGFGLLWFLRSLVARRFRRRLQRIVQQALDGDAKGAISDLEHERRIRGDDPDVLISLAQCYGAAARWEDALRVYQELLPRFPHMTLLSFNEGICLIHLNRLAEAVSTFRRVGPTLADDSASLCPYVDVLAKLGQTDRARRLLGHATEALQLRSDIQGQPREAREYQLHQLRQRLGVLE